MKRRVQQHVTAATRRPPALNARHAFMSWGVTRCHVSPREGELELKLELREVLFSEAEARQNEIPIQLAGN
eukprot:m.470249 g.470249  ORF g.470249 m.470249 type:complete len:71 (+) comp29563_c0_seq1:1830-2042(+)